MKATNSFNIGDHVVDFVPKKDSKDKGSAINGNVIRITSLGVYVTDGIKSSVDQLKLEASEWFNSEVCGIRRA